MVLDQKETLADLKKKALERRKTIEINLIQQAQIAKRANEQIKPDSAENRVAMDTKFGKGKLKKAKTTHVDEDELFDLALSKTKTVIDKRESETWNKDAISSKQRSTMKESQIQRQSTFSNASMAQSQRNVRQNDERNFKRILFGQVEAEETIKNLRNAQEVVKNKLQIKKLKTGSSRQSRSGDSEHLLERVDEEPLTGHQAGDHDHKSCNKGRVQFEMPVEFVNVSHSGNTDSDEHQMDEIVLADNYYCLAIYAFFVTEEELEHDAQTKTDERIYANEVLAN